MAGIVSLHFTGMAAFVVTPLEGVEPGADSPAFTAMAIAVAIAGILILGTGVATYLIEQRMREASEDKLRHMALHDPLTGLPNRTSFYARLDARLDGPHAHDTAIAAIDLNRFKEINDSWGHAAGDHVLIVLAERLRKFDGSRHFAARWRRPRARASASPSIRVTARPATRWCATPTWPCTRPRPIP